MWMLSSTFVYDAIEQELLFPVKPFIQLYILNFMDFLGDGSIGKH